VVRIRAREHGRLGQRHREHQAQSSGRASFSAAPASSCPRAQGWGQTLLEKVPDSCVNRTVTAAASSEPASEAGCAPAYRGQTDE
jgi:hypothetical protein